MTDIVVIGAGAAGFLAAITAARAGASVMLLEKMPYPGKKLLITGKGRCNLTNDCSHEELIRNLPGNGRFLHSAFKQFSVEDIIRFFEQEGVPLKVERGQRVFPVSDKAGDIVACLGRTAHKAGVVLKTSSPVTKILVDSGRIVGVEVNHKEQIACQMVILATGGSSYPGTGTTGDGYRMAKEIGHHITPLKPSLVPFECNYPNLQDLMGSSLKNVEASLYQDDKSVQKEFGELLITHFGLSGPIILTLSRRYNELSLTAPKAQYSIRINLKPALSAEQLDKRLQRDFQEFQRKQLKNALNELLPQKLILPIIIAAGLPPDHFIHDLTRAERLALRQTLQDWRFPIKGTRPLVEAIVTAGGVAVTEVNPKTMASKKVAGLFVVGETLDVDGFTGGFNLQAAFSSGYVAGKYAAEQLQANTQGVE